MPNPVKLFYGLTKAQVQQYVDGIYNGDITEDQLSPEVYLAVGEYLADAVEEGFGMKFAYSYGKDLDLLNVLRNNVFMFAAGKDYEMTKAISSLLIDEKDNIRTEKEFNEVASATYDNWMNNYGSTEWSTALGQAYSIQKWKQIELQKDILPYLEYSTIDMPCDICAPFNNLVAAVDDPIWNLIAPLNHFNCKCILIQLPEGVKLTPQDDKDLIMKKVLPLMQAEFRSNPGKDKLIFNEAHPYFHMCILPGGPQASAAPAIDCHNNFGLGKPEEIKNEQTLHSYEEAKAIMEKYEIPKERAEAIANYMGQGYVSLNEQLRKGEDFILQKQIKFFEKDTPELRAKVAGYIKDNNLLSNNLSEFLENAPHLEMATYRGLSFQNETEARAFENEFTEGKVVTDKGFMSTSLDKGTAYSFSTKYEMNAQIEIEGKNGVLVDKWGRGTEKELLFNKNSQFKVESITKEEELWKKENLYKKDYKKIGTVRRIDYKVKLKEIVPGVEEKIEEPVKLKSYDEALSVMRKYKITPSAKKAIEDYSSSGYASLNEQLRKGEDFITKKQIEIVGDDTPIIRKRAATIIKENKVFADNLSSFIKEAPKVELTTYRGVQLKLGFGDTEESAKAKFYKIAENYKKGNIIKDDGFLSTSVNINMAKDFTLTGNYIIEMEIEGKNGVLIQPWGVASEQEVIFDRGTKFQVISSELKEAIDETKEPAVLKVKLKEL